VAQVGAVAKLTDSACVDPDLTKVAAGVTFTLCDDTVGTGTYVPPAGPNLTLLVAGNIKSGVTINGVAGTLVPSPDLTALVASNVKQGVTIAGVAGVVVPSPDLTALTAGNLKSGVTIAGVTGSFPSVSSPLTGSSGAALTSATFNARLADSGTVFEYFGADGTRYTGSGDANLLAGNVKSGKTIFGVAGSVSVPTISAQDLRVGVTAGAVTGTLKVNCRNMNDTVHTSGATGVDDTNGGFFSSLTQLVTGSTADNSCDGSDWVDLTPGTTCTNDPAHCMMKDPISGLTWGVPFSAYVTWATADAGCSALSYNGLSGWRLPSQKELMSAYVNGWSRAAPAVLAAGPMWSRTTVSSNSTYSFMVNLGVGTSSFYLKTNSALMGYTCVR